MSQSVIKLQQDQDSEKSSPTHLALRLTPCQGGVTLKDGTQFPPRLIGRPLPDPFRRTAQWPRLF
jgi:hypothetical protein